MIQYPAAAQGLKTMHTGGWLSVIGTLLTLLSPLIGLILALIGGIMTLLGLIKAGRDDAGYRTALYLNIVVIVVGLFVNANSMLGRILEIVMSLISLAVIYYICTTTMKLLRNVGREDVAKNGDVVVKINVVCTVISILVNIGLVASNLAIILLLISVIAGVVGQIMHIGFLKRSYKTLELAVQLD